jgi:tRNA1(Val) A37 N6-methylase TrmN6
VVLFPEKSDEPLWRRIVGAVTFLAVASCAEQHEPRAAPIVARRLGYDSIAPGAIINVCKPEDEACVTTIQSPARTLGWEIPWGGPTYLSSRQRSRPGAQHTVAAIPPGAERSVGAGACPKAGGPDRRGSATRAAPYDSKEFGGESVDCCSTEVLEQQFGPKVADAELRRYRRWGARRTTRLLLRGLRAHLPPDASLLDVGGGIGALHHELLASGVARAWAVEPSAAFLHAAQAEARRRGHAGRVEFIHADIRAAAATVPDADIVTLDRVVCCDPDYESLLHLALGKARQLFGYSYPRDRVAVRATVALQNAFRRLRRSGFRVFVHPPERMTAIIQTAGFVTAFRARTLVWQVEVYSRRAAA